MSPSDALRRLALSLAAVAGACTSATNDAADGGSSSGDTGGSSEGGGGGFDDSAAIARALAYRDDFTQVSDQPRASQHGLAETVQVWASAEALAAYRALDPAGTDAAQWPPGSMLLKEHLDAGGTVTGFTVMAQGDPGSDSGGWWWARLDADGTVHETGQVGFCIGCHTTVAARGWAYGVPLDNRR